MNTLSRSIRHVVKVLQSCRTDEQRSNATHWAVTVITAQALQLIKHPKGSSAKGIK